MKSAATALQAARVPEASGAGEVARFAAIARVAAAKGWGRYIEALGFSRDEHAAAGTPRSDAVRLREALEELGPTFVKFGQMLSQREDLFPAALVKELRSLQDHAGSFPAPTARRIIEEETGRKVSELFGRFDDQPMAAASIAQVPRSSFPRRPARCGKVCQCSASRVSSLPAFWAPPGPCWR